MTEQIKNSLSLLEDNPEGYDEYVTNITEKLDGMDTKSVIGCFVVYLEKIYHAELMTIVKIKGMIFLLGIVFSLLLFYSGLLYHYQDAQIRDLTKVVSNQNANIEKLLHMSNSLVNKSHLTGWDENVNGVKIKIPHLPLPKGGTLLNAH